MESIEKCILKICFGELYALKISIILSFEWKYTYEKCSVVLIPGIHVQMQFISGW